MDSLVVKVGILALAFVVGLLIYIVLRAYLREVIRCNKSGARVLVRRNLRTTFYVSKRVYEVDSRIFCGNTKEQGPTISVCIIGISPEAVVFPQKDSTPVLVIEANLATPERYLESYMPRACKSDFK